MKKKNTIFSQSYKVGISVFFILVFIISALVVALIRGFSGDTNYKKIEIKDTLISTYDKPDTVRVDVIKEILKTDTLYVTCKKKHCEEIHTTSDTTK